MAGPEKANLADKMARTSDRWNPRIVGEVNDMQIDTQIDTQIKPVKMQSAFDWHHHQTKDELFLVLQVEHLPAPEEEAHLPLIETKPTLNAGNIYNGRTWTDLERL